MLSLKRANFTNNQGQTQGFWVIPGNRAFVSIVASEAHACALAVDGAAYCWGSDNWEQLGNGAGGNAQSPSLVDTSTITGNKAFVALAVGGSHTCGLMADGAAYCWGYDLQGQLGNGALTGDQPSPTLVETSSMSGNTAFVSLAASRFISCGIAADGAPHCWGTFGGVRPAPVDTSGIATNRAFRWLKSGNQHACGIAADGLAFCWGEDGLGQLGNGPVTGPQSDPYPVDTSGLP